MLRKSRPPDSWPPSILLGLQGGPAFTPIARLRGFPPEKRSTEVETGAPAALWPLPSRPLLLGRVRGSALFVLWRVRILFISGSMCPPAACPAPGRILEEQCQGRVPKDHAKASLPAAPVVSSGISQVPLTIHSPRPSLTTAQVSGASSGLHARPVLKACDAGGGSVWLDFSMEMEGGNFG